MRRLLETDYAYTILPTHNAEATSSSMIPHTVRLTRSLLDADFDDEEDKDELEQYITEKPANRETDVLMWWKVSGTC
jgi:hypothetical protein